MCILQPFSPLLFSRGPPRGPAILLRKLSKELTADEAAEAWKEEGETENAKTDGLDPMKQKYRCMSCHLQKRESMLPLENFGVTDRQRFYADFVTQGCWTRCLSCAKAKNLPVPGAAANNSSTLKMDVGSAHNAGRVCIRCAEKFPGQQIQMNNHVCSGCRKELPKDHWGVKIVENHLSPQKTNLICKECEGRGCSARDAKLYHCDGCDQHFGHTRFSKHQLYDKAKTARREDMLLCGNVASDCSVMG